MTDVRAPDGTTIRFPDSMKSDQITSVMRQKFPPTAAARPAAAAAQPPATKPSSVPAQPPATSWDRPPPPAAAPVGSINPITNFTGQEAAAWQAIKGGAAKLNPFSPERRQETIEAGKKPFLSMPSGLARTGSGLYDIASGLFRGHPYVAAATAGAETAGNLAEKGASYAAPGQKIVRSGDVQTALMGARAGHVPGKVLPGAGVPGEAPRVPGVGAPMNAAREFAMPEALTPEGAKAGATLREHTGLGALETAKTMDKAAPHEYTAASMPREHQIDFIDYMQGHKSDKEATDWHAAQPPDVKKMASVMKEAFEQRRDRLQAGGDHLEFRKEYFPNRWAAAPGGEPLEKQWFQGRQRLGFKEGIEEGFVPRTTNPFDVFADYFTTADRFLARKAILKAGEDEGFIKRFNTNVPKKDTVAPTAGRVSDLVPALRKPNGSVLYGKRGDLHSDIAPGEPEEVWRAPGASGFAFPDGQYLTRAEAEKFASTGQLPASGEAAKQAKIPEGYVEINPGKNAGAVKEIAPVGWAKVYNRFVSDSIKAKVQTFAGPEWGGKAGKAVDAITHAKNSQTALNLGLGAYHGVATVKEALATEVSQGIAKLMAPGQRMSGMASILKAPAAPALFLAKGRRMAAEAVGRPTKEPGALGKFKTKVFGGGSPEAKAMTQKIIDLQARAGGRLAGGRVHSLGEYSLSRKGAFLPVKRMIEEPIPALKAAINRVKGVAAKVNQFAHHPTNIMAYTTRKFGQVVKTGAGDPKASAKVAAAHTVNFIERTLDTIAYPLFEKMVPYMKNGAFHEIMSDWLYAHPTASDTEALTFARSAWDSVDNRYGEMVKDNIFMPNAVKQGLQVAATSFSYEYGTLREFGGGASDLLKLRPLGITESGWNPRTAYVLAYPIVDVLLNSAYQYMKTGQAPQNALDAISPQTGGKNDDGSPERVYPIGNMKDLHELLSTPQDPFGTVKGWFGAKTSPFLNATWALAKGSDYQNDPIWTGDTYFDQTISALRYVLDQVTPIAIQNARKRPLESNISNIEGVLGARHAGLNYTNPSVIELSKQHKDIEGRVKKALHEGDFIEAQKLAARIPKSWARTKLDADIKTYMKHHPGNMQQRTIKKPDPDMPSSSAGGAW